MADKRCCLISLFSFVVGGGGGAGAAAVAAVAIAVDVNFFVVVNTILVVILIVFLMVTAMVHAALTSLPWCMQSSTSKTLVAGKLF